MRARGKKVITWKGLLLKWAGLLTGGLLVLVLIAGLLAKVLITKEFLVKEIEKSINSEVEIGELELSLFQLPARITLSEVSLAPGNSAEKAPIQIEEVDLSVQLWGLFMRHINVTNLTVRGAEITATYHQDGSTSIEPLFESPDQNDARKREKDDGFNISDHEDFVATLGGLAIVDSTVDMTLEEMGLRLHCTEMNLTLHSIKIDPARLAETNTARLDLSSRVTIDSVDGWPYGDLLVSGEATALVFDPVSGEVEPEVVGDFSLGEESWLNTRVPFITRAWSYLTILEKAGIKVVTLPEKATFGRSKAVAAHYHRGRITVNKSLSLWVGDWELAAIAGSWIDTATDQHEIQSELLASRDSSARFRSLARKGVALFPEKVRDALGGDVGQKLLEDERLVVGIKSSGEFSDPIIRPVGVIMDVTEAAQGAAAKLLKEKAGGLLDGLLGRDDEEETD